MMTNAVDMLDVLLEPLEFPSQCRCSTTDGLRCKSFADGDGMLCTPCLRGTAHMPIRSIQSFRDEGGFGWINTAELDCP